MKPSIYLAAPWGCKAEAILAAQQFERAGIEVTSRWFKHAGDPNDSTGITAPDADIRNQALEDMADVRRSDLLVVLNLQKSEGKAVETGVALAYGKPIVFVGQRSNIFQVLGTQTHTVTEAVEVVRATLMPSPAV